MFAEAQRPGKAIYATASGTDGAGGRRRCRDRMDRSHQPDGAKTAVDVQLSFLSVSCDSPQHAFRRRFDARGVDPQRQRTPSGNVVEAEKYLTSGYFKSSRHF